MTQQLLCRQLEGVALDQAISLPREQLEQGLSLQGLLLFRNELKLDTAQAISDLKQGQVPIFYICSILENMQTCMCCLVAACKVKV